MKRRLGLVLLLGISTANAMDDMCVAQAYTYGLATKAQDKCHFNYWNARATESENACYALAGKQGKAKLFDTAVKRGAKDFSDKYQTTPDKKGLCNDFADDFPDYVKN